METHPGVATDARTGSLRFLRSGAGLDFGLCRHTAADQVKVQHRDSDAGGIHPALYVDDFEAALAHLIAHGVQLMREPTVRTTAPSPAQTWVYLLAPGSTPGDLVGHPSRQGCERHTPRRLWGPRNPNT